MKLSTKGRYAVRLMLDLAIHKKNEPVLLKDIAQRQEISEKYLWHLIPPLKNAGFINSTRGAHGGYGLARQPAAVTVKDIVVAVEGPISLVGCLDHPARCDRTNECVTREVWCAFSEKIAAIFDSVTLGDLVEDHYKRQGIVSYSI